MIVSNQPTIVEWLFLAEARPTLASENGIDLIAVQPEFLHASTMLWRAKIWTKLRVHRIAQIAVPSAKRRRSEWKLGSLAVRSRFVLHGLKDRASVTLRQYVVSQGGARIRIDRTRAKCRRNSRSFATVTSSNVTLTSPVGHRTVAQQAISPPFSTCSNQHDMPGKLNRLCGYAVLLDVRRGSADSDSRIDR
jgi:hypothetical protein